MGHLVPADGSNTAVVSRYQLLRVIEGRLEDPGRDEDAVDLAVVVGVDVCG